MTEVDMKIGFSPETRQWRQRLPPWTDGLTGAPNSGCSPCATAPLVYGTAQKNPKKGFSLNTLQ
jgi:hypothetical protein